MIAIRLAKKDWGKAWRAMIDIAPIRLIAADPIYEVLPAHLELLAQRGVPYEIVTPERRNAGTKGKGAMPRPIRAIEVYLPLESNEGVAFPESRYVGLQHELLRRFGGVTSTQRQFPLQGLWRHEHEVFDDRVVVMSAMDFGSSPLLGTIQYLERMKTRLKKKFAQLEILITVQELLAV